jgi:hypothetical protein
MAQEAGRFELELSDVGRWFLRRDGQATQITTLVNPGLWLTDDKQERAADGKAISSEGSASDLVERLPEGWPEQTP